MSTLEIVTTRDDQVDLLEPHPDARHGEERDRLAGLGQRQAVSVRSPGDETDREPTGPFPSSSLSAMVMPAMPDSSEAGSVAADRVGSAAG